MVGDTDILNPLLLDDAVQFEIPLISVSFRPLGGEGDA